MLILLSPAKALNFDPAPADLEASAPELSKDTRELLKTAKTLSRADLARLMRISDKLADLNFDRFQAFKPTGRGAETKQALLAFAGDVYQGLEAASLGRADLAYAQDRLRILSGLYGVLRPLDAIQPYRLEMGTKLATGRGEDLYAFWGDRIAKALNKAAKAAGAEAILNLASNEYFKAVDQSALDLPVISPVFKEEKDGALKSLMYYAKRARGMMARYAIQSRARTPADLKTFTLGGYAYRQALSEGGEWVFTRPQPPAKAA